MLASNSARPLSPSIADCSFLSSGLARTFGRAAFARPTPVSRRAFQPINGLPSLSARLASTSATSAGKIHQVIGAVVDGMFSLPLWRPCRQARENLFRRLNPSQHPPKTFQWVCHEPYLTFPCSQVRG